MSNKLQNVLDEIKLEKDTYLLPENIKKDVKIFDIVGTLEEGGASTDVPVKLFETQEEMQADETAEEGDLAVVYRSEVQNATVDSKFQIATFPETVVLSEAMTDYTELTYRATDSSIMFDGRGHLDNSGFTMDCWVESDDEYKNIRIEYTSEDGITYIRTDTLGNPVDFTTEIYYTDTDTWNDRIGKFIQVGGSTFGGLFVGESIIKQIQPIKMSTMTINAETGVPNISDVITLNYNVNNFAEKIYPMVKYIDTLEGMNSHSRYPYCIYLKDNNTVSIIADGSSSSSVMLACPVFVNNTFKGLVAASYNVPNFYEWQFNLSTGEYIGRNDIVATDYTTFGSSTSKYYYTTEFNDYYYIGNMDWTGNNFNYLYSLLYNNTSNSANTLAMTGIIGIVYFLAPTQLTLNNPNELLPGKIAYGKNGVITGDDSVYDNLDYDSIWSKYYIKSSGKNGVLKVYNTDIQLPPVITYNESEENTSSYIYVNSATTNFPYVIDEEGASKYTTDYYVKLSDNEVMRFESSSSSTKLQKYTLNDGVITISLYDTLSSFTFTTGNYHLVAKYDASDDCIYIINPTGNNFKFYKYNMGTKELTQLFGNSSLNLNINYCWYDICLENQTIFVYGVYTEFLAITFEGVATKIEDVTLTSFYSYNPSNSYSNTYMLTYNGTESSAKIYNMKTKSYTDIVIDNLKNCQLYDNNDGTATYVLCDDTLYKIQDDELIKTTTIDKTALDLIQYDNNGNKFSSTSQCISATNIPIAFNDKIYGRFMYIDTTTDIAYINTQIMKAPFVLYHNKGHICSVGSTVYQFTYVNLVEDGVGQYVAFINSGNTSYSVTQYDTNNIKNKFTLNSSIMSQDEYTEALNTVDEILGEEV